MAKNNNDNLNYRIGEIANIYSCFDESNISNLILEFKNQISENLNGSKFENYINDFFNKSIKIDFKKNNNEPSVNLQISALTNILFLYFSENKNYPFTLLARAFKDTLSSLLLRTIQVSDHQIQILIDAIISVFDFVKNQIVNNGYKCFILELPVGNSIPSKLLMKIIEEHGLEVYNIQISLNRNDKKVKGITRRELIKSKIPKSENDLIIYIDEWITGANFNKIVTYVSKETNAKLLPCALLSNNSINQDKYKNFAQDHDDISKKNGVKGCDFRYTIPRLNQIVSSPQEFIWVEYDRLAGYRKLELAGSIYSTLKSAIESLVSDAVNLEELMQFHLKDDMNSILIPELKASVEYYLDIFDLVFVENVSNYFNPVNLINVGEDMERFIKIMEDTEGYEKAKFAISFAFLMINSEVDPKSRYFFIDKVPICEELVGDEIILNELFITHLIKLLKEKLSDKA